MKVIKRSDAEQDFCLDKIKRAVRLANNAVQEQDRMDDETVENVIAAVQKRLEGYNSINVKDIHDFVEEAISQYNFKVSKAYILYRENKEKSKKFTEDEEKIIALINGNSELRGDNANKHIDDNGAISDYIAGINTKSINNKLLPKEIINAHKNGLIHWHDADYSPLRPMHNCDLLNIEDMFGPNGFQMQSTKISPDSETPFSTACNLMAQVNLIVSGRQYGGQTVSWAHLLPFIANSRRLIREEVTESYYEDLKNEPKIIKAARRFFMALGINTYMNEEQISKKVEKKLRKEIYDGVKTYQYQILCHSSSNGQTPFVSNNLCLREARTQQELDDFAILIEEILKRRIKGVMDESGHFISPLFPKLLYWTCDGLNVKPGDPYYYLTELAAECIAKRMQPDIVSESETRKVKQGQIIPSMGCRSLLSPIWEDNEYPIGTKFYWTVGATYPYGEFVEERDFSSIANGEYQPGIYSINFRGNTGWLIKKTGESVTIREPKVYGRWNNGVVTINLPHVALEARAAEMKKLAKGEELDPEKVKATFYEIFADRLELCHRALKMRYEYCRKIKAKNSEILWKHGALARLSAEETVGDLMDRYPKRATISLGYVGLCETCRALIGESNTTENGRELSKAILTYMNDTCNKWKADDIINYAIYGTPEESLTYKFALANRKDFGIVEYVTDKDYVVNSYHVDPRETIDAFRKLEIEGEYLALSSGGAVSYVETPDLTNNIPAIVTIIQWMNDHIMYAEINRKIGICYKCGYEGDIPLTKTEDGDFKFTCPNCGNDDDNEMHVTARICGYLGTVNAGNTNKGRLDDIYHRTLHTDCYDELQ